MIKFVTSSCSWHHHCYEVFRNYVHIFCRADIARLALHFTIFLLLQWNLTAFSVDQFVIWMAFLLMIQVYMHI